MPGVRSYHVPRKFPNCDCGVSALNHYVDHIAKGEPCYCGLPAKNHRKRGPLNRNSNARERNNRERDRDIKYIGIDGEGQGRLPHNYNLLAASYEDGSDCWTVEPHGNSQRLTTEQCLDLILELPTRRTKIFSFSFNYDLTKMLMDLPDELLYKFFRPELRQRKGTDAIKGPFPVIWGKYQLNLQGTKFSVRCGKKRVVIWDLFKFFQGKFVNALREWKVGEPALHDRMELMKNKRSEFDKESRGAVLEYCLEETRCIAQLARKLVEAHSGAGLVLKSFYGAGSSGAAMLDAMGVKSRIVKTMQEMAEAVESGFFGGRFENSVIGDIRESLHNWDISSAYPYQLAFLPCLEHCSWRRTKNRGDLDDVQVQNGAIVRYTLGPHKDSTGWGPYPFRTEDGSISFPIESGGGWIWLDEYIQGEKLWPNVEFREAWVYERHCDCKPFAQVPDYYNLRLRIGKEGPGLVIKLGMNSCYGKLAQSVGNAIFNSWIWAGMITSGCRAQLLQLIGLHENRENVLMLATDGLLTRETIVPPEPLFTGTAGTGKPLGGWEHKDAAKGMFIARPGIYFPLSPTQEEIASVRARGVGRGVVLESWQKIVDAWAENGIEGVARVANVQRFCGGKTSISQSAKGTIYRRASHDDGIKPAYGEWIARKVELSFDPLPKRECLHEDGLRLVLRRFPRDLLSRPYDRAVAMHSKEAIEMRLATDELNEQPDGDFCYE